MRLNESSEEEIENARKNWGYYFVVAGSSFGRSAEAINFYVAIHEAGYPVVLTDGKDLLNRLEGKDLVGIVPWDVPTRYCEEYFPEKYGTILDFIHVFSEDYDEAKKYIEWLPTEQNAVCDK